MVVDSCAGGFMTSLLGAFFLALVLAVWRSTSRRAREVGCPFSVLFLLTLTLFHSLQNGAYDSADYSSLGRIAGGSGHVFHELVS